jgi:hypothetical protein
MDEGLVPQVTQAKLGKMAWSWIEASEKLAGKGLQIVNTP